MTRILALFLAFGFILFSETPTAAQTIQLGTGTGEQWEYSSGPVNIYYRRTVCQFVYTAAELSAAGASTINPITDMGLFVTGAPAYNIPGYTVKIKHTTATDVSAALGTTGWTTVKNSFTYAPTAGDWDMLGLDNQTFVWDGTSSIGVEICWSRVTPTWNASGQVRIYSSTNGYRYSWTDAAGSSCGSTPGTTSSNKPQMQFVFVPGTTTTWNGSVSTDWFNEANWSAGVPTSLMDAVIPSGPSNQPVINGEATTRDITINTDASLTFNDSDTLNIHGDWTLNGNFTKATGTLIFRGTGVTANLMTGKNDQDLYNVEVRSDAGVTLSSGTYNVEGALRLRGGNFTSNNRVTLTSDGSGAGSLTEISNMCSYELDMSDSYGDGWNGGTVRVDIDGETYGTFNAEGTGSIVNVNIPSGASYELIYSSGLYENENTYDFNDPLGVTEFSDGPTPATGIVHSGTATCAFVNSYGGNLTVQRYLPLSNDGWREISGGVSAATLSDWQDDGLIMSGFTGSDYPSFSFINVYTYNENAADGDKNNGWAAASNITDLIDPTAGHRVYIGTGSWTAEIDGPPLTGDRSFTLDYQNDAGAADQEGWNLIGNPYPCSIDWDSIAIGNKVNIDNAIWIWNATAGNYGVYSGGTGGVGTNNVNADIPSSQAFWVHATAASPSLVIQEDDKTEADPAFVKSWNTNENLRVKLTGDVNAYSDEAIVVWRDGADDHFDMLDGPKLYSSVEEAPSICFITDSTYHVSINALSSYSQYVSMPLEVLVGLSGNYQLEFDIADLDPTSCLVLEDLAEDSLIDLHQNNTYNFSMSMLYTGSRFVLHTGQSYNGQIWERCNSLPGQNQEPALDIDEESIDVRVYPNPAKNVLKIDFEEQEFRITKLEILSIIGSTVESWENPSQTEFDITNLPNGNYILRISSDSSYILEQFSIMR